MQADRAARDSLSHEDARIFATAIFLRVNGYRLVVSADGGEAFLIQQVIVGRCELDVIEPWLEHHMQPAG